MCTILQCVKHFFSQDFRIRARLCYTTCYICVISTTLLLYYLYYNILYYFIQGQKQQWTYTDVTQFPLSILDHWKKCCVYRYQTSLWGKWWCFSSGARQGNFNGGAPSGTRFQNKRHAVWNSLLTGQAVNLSAVLNFQVFVL